MKLALKFDSITNQTHVITSLRDAAQSGFLGKFPVCPTCISGAASCDDITPTTDSPTPTGPSNGKFHDITPILVPHCLKKDQCPSIPLP